MLKQIAEYATASLCFSTALNLGRYFGWDGFSGALDFVNDAAIIMVTVMALVFLIIASLLGHDIDLMIDVALGFCLITLLLYAIVSGIALLLLI